MARKTTRTTSSCPPLYATPVPSPKQGDPNYVRGAWFDPAAVDRVVKALSGLRHTKGRWDNKPLVPDDWQLEWIISPVFGWKHPKTAENPDGTRIIRTAWIEVPRKNGKSTLSSGLSIVLLVADGEVGAEVYAAATTRPQAGIVFDEAKRMVLRSPRLSKKLKPLASVIKVPSKGSIYRVLSRVAEAAHGLNVSGAVIDEVHVHKSRDLIDAIETGTGFRDQPLVIFITTADEGDEFSIYAEKHDRTIKIANGILKDPSFYGVIWAATEKDDPFAEKTWKGCNPGYGKTIQKRYLEKEAEKARTEPSYLNTFCRLHLNLRRKAESSWFNLNDWDENAGAVIPEHLEGRDCFGGLDLSAVNDLTSFELVFPFEPDDPDAELDEETGEGIRRFEILSWFWLPEEGIEDRVKKQQVPYDEWSRDGQFLELTPGNVVDYDYIEDAVIGATEDFNLRRLSYDRKFAGQIVTHLQNYTECVPVSQTFEGMSAAAKWLERAILQRALRHGGHPVLRWNAECVEVLRDNNDNIRPVKPNRQKTKKRVDGIVALVNAGDGYVRMPEEEKTSHAAAGF